MNTASLHRNYLHGILFSCIFLAMTVFTAVCHSATDVIPVHYRDASEVFPIVKNMLSPEGKATFDVRTNSLILTDTPDSIQRVRAFLETFDTPVPQVRIRVRFHEPRSSSEQSVSAGGGVSGEDWRVSVGGARRDGIEIQAEAESREGRRVSEYTVVTSSGSPAYILTGLEVPHRQRWFSLCRRYAVCTETVTFQRIDTGMEILPVVVGDRVNIKIIPRISDPTHAGGEVVSRFTRAATQLSVPLGEWVTIGGVETETNEVMRAILEAGSESRSEHLVMSLMVEKF